jgi:methylglutaconyl-CoA hydratase
MCTSPSVQRLSISRDGHIARITLNHPEVRNAFDDATILELTSTFRELDTDDNVRVVVLAAEGETFCAGADLNWMKRMAEYSVEENRADALNLAKMLNAVYRCSKPVIARVQGDVYAGGVGLVAACDIAISVDTAKFCLSEARLGLMPATIAPYVIRAMGARAAHRYFVTAERFDALDAMLLGFVHKVVSPADLDSKVDAIAKAIVNNSPNAVRECKRLVLDFVDREINDDLISETAERIARIRASEEGREGVRSFLEKRKPAWLV